jgi:hypothetical protein
MGEDEADDDIQSSRLRFLMLSDGRFFPGPHPQAAPADLITGKEACAPAVHAHDPVGR